MIELPECYVLAEQINETLAGKTIAEATANAHPHGFAWFTGEPAVYNAMLAGKRITAAHPGTAHTCGGNTEIECEDMLLVISTPIKYHAPGAKIAPKHQLLLRFTDDSHMSCTVQMWGAMFCYPIAESQLPESFICPKEPKPLSGDFDRAYFDALWAAAKPTLSAKAFLATEQRIPGLGNGVLQDILFNARIHPKRKLAQMTDVDKEHLFASVKSTLADMTARGGRDTEKDLHGRSGGYTTILSSKTAGGPCLVCGSNIVKEAYLGGSIYYCPGCQPVP